MVNPCAIIIIINLILATQAFSSSQQNILDDINISDFTNKEDIVPQLSFNKRMLNSVFKNTLFESIIKKHQDYERLKEMKRLADLERLQEKENKIYSILVKKVQS